MVRRRNDEALDLLVELLCDADVEGDDPEAEAKLKARNTYFKVKAQYG
jgi:hypothetical protein